MNGIVVTAEREYVVDFVEDWKLELTKTVSDKQVCVLVPSSLFHFAQGLPAEWLVVKVPDGEVQKSPATYISVLEKLVEERFTRDCFIVGIGGGATTDLAGFVAATFLRGVDWIAVPTSLAAMVDAAVGGKTGINLEGGKNLAGAFHSPRKVIICRDFLSTLPERDLKAGLAEVAKCGFIADPKILELINTDWKLHLDELITRSISVKARVVGKDFKESFDREILNYGHTLGHAIERHSNYELRHGECVAIGLVYAAALSERFSGLSAKEVALHRSVLDSLGLSTSYSAGAWDSLYELMLRDKKNRSTLRFVTLTSIGKPTRLENPSVEALKEIYEQVIGR